MKYLVTGATGFIGTPVVRLLVEKKHEVHALVRHPDQAQALADQGVILHTGDITDPATIKPAMQGMDGVFHLAGWYEVGTRNQSMAEAVNVEGTRNVLNAMKELGIQRGVYTSTLGVLGDTHGQVVDETYRPEPPTESKYVQVKWRAHYEVAEPMIKAGLPLIIVQPGIVYGPGDHSVIGDSLRLWLRGLLPIIPPGGGCWAHVEDTAQGIVYAMEKGKPGETYMIGGPHQRMAEAMELASRITGKPLPPLRGSRGMMLAMAALQSFFGILIPFPPPFAGETLRASVVTYWGSSAKAEKELGFKPRPLEEGLKETLDYEIMKMRNH
jgi:nucleoside-diphosphate-sugar epimerase